MITRLKKTLSHIDIIESTYRKLRARCARVIITLSPALYTKCRFRLSLGKWPNLANPESFDEKLLWLMLYHRNPLATRCADKYAVRSYVEELGLGSLLPRQYGVYERVDEIDFSKLPQQHVLKCTHGCGFNIICADKDKLDVRDAKRKLKKWLNVDFSKVKGEVHYAGIKPRIVCQEYLSESENELPSDYKIYCFNGMPHCTMACTERMPNGPAKYDFYDLEWKNKLPYSRTSLLANRTIAKPKGYEEMIAAAAKLSRPFLFVRIDFYSIKGKPVFGEMTLTPSGCVDKNYTDIAQMEMGALIKLPK